jgi:hypothetical protein
LERVLKIYSANLIKFRRVHPFLNKNYAFLNISGFHPTIFRLPVVMIGFRYGEFTTDLLDGMSDFDGIQNRDDLVFSRSDLTHCDLLGDIISISVDL